MKHSAIDTKNFKKKKWKKIDPNSKKTAWTIQELQK